MSDVIDTPVTDEDELSFWGKHRFLLLIVLTIVVAVIMTCVSIVMYNVSGTAQLDLSRPGYQSVSDQVDTDNTIDDYAAFGPVNKTTVDEFTKIYDEQAKKAKAVDAFSGDPLNPEVLILGTSNATE
jgi:hypothetical protein